MAQIPGEEEHLHGLIERVDHLIARLAHDLRGRLQAVSGYADLLSEERTGPLNARQKQFLEHIQEGTHGVLEVIDSGRERLQALIQPESKLP